MESYICNLDGIQLNYPSLKGMSLFVSRNCRKQYYLAFQLWCHVSSLLALGPGAPPETLREEGQLGCVPPPGLEASRVKKNSWGFLFTGIVGGTLVAVYAVATPFITPALRRICLPFVPATTKQIENVVKMLRGRRGSVVDVGSGDGRIVS